jgi:hypothetical protein
MLNTLFSPRTLLLLAVAMALPSCKSVRSKMDTKPAEPSRFLDPTHQMREMGTKSPFHRAYSNPVPEQLEISAKRSEIYIAPVETLYLRPIGTKLAGAQYRLLKKDRPVSRITDEIRREFIEAFEESSEPRYRIVYTPTPDSVTLQLALVELDPSSVTGNIVRKGASVVLTPAAALGSVFTNGKIAIEGRLIDSTEKWSLFEFRDREKDKITFWTLRDFKPYGHSKVAIREWARQFEETTRNPEWKEMGDARLWTIAPW